MRHPRLVRHSRLVRHLCLVRRPRERRLLQFRLLVGKIGPQRDLIKGSKTFFGTIVQRDPD